METIKEEGEEAWIQGRYMTVLRVNNYTKFLDHPYEIESLAFPLGMMKHGTIVYTTPRNLGGDGGLYVDEEYLPFCWDNKNLYFSIDKPTEEDLEELDVFELNSPTPNGIW